MTIVKRLNSKGDKAYFYIDHGRDAGKRPSTGIFIYTRPKNQIEKNHNKEALTLISPRFDYILYYFIDLIKFQVDVILVTK